MSKFSIKTLTVFRRLKKYRLETGFTMLEAVVVVGVLLALAVAGFISYGPIIDNAKKAKLVSTASEIHTAITAASFDGDSTTTPQDVVDKFNSSNNKIKVEILQPTAVTPAMTTSSTAPADGIDFCVQATDLENAKFTARAGDCTGVPGGNTPPDNSSPSATFDAITDAPGASSQGIRYINATLADDASVATRSQDRDIIAASNEGIEKDSAYKELTHFEVYEYDTDPYFRIDSGLPALNDDYQTKLSGFEAEPTLANQQAMVTAHRALFAAVVANPIPESGRVLVPAPSNPEKFQDVTIAAGSHAPVVVRVAIPTSLYKTGWGLGAGWLNGIDLGGSVVGTDGAYTYWDVTISSNAWITDSNGTITGVSWKAGIYDAFLTAMDNQGVSHSMNFRVTVK